MIAFSKFFSHLISKSFGLHVDCHLAEWIGSFARIFWRYVKTGLAGTVQSRFYGTSDSVGALGPLATPFHTSGLTAWCFSFLWRDWFSGPLSLLYEFQHKEI